MSGNVLYNDTHTLNLMVSHLIFVHQFMKNNYKSYRFGAITSALICFLILVEPPVYGQHQPYSGIPSLVWPLLYDIKYKKAQDAFGAYDQPVFSEAVKKMEGKEITLPGYMIPFEGATQSEEFMFSSMPLNACFFCGIGGPETVVQIRMAEATSYDDKPVEIKGRLKLNIDNPDQHFYILEESVNLGPVSW